MSLAPKETSNLVFPISWGNKFGVRISRCECHQPLQSHSRKGYNLLCKVFEVTIDLLAAILPQDINPEFI